MADTTISTIIKMLESLPENAQEQVAERLREYIEEIRDELQWDQMFRKTQSQLVARARQARQEAAAGQAKPFDYEEL